MEKVLNDYFNTDDLVSKGVPTVHYIADKLNVSPKYLLKLFTGQSTQQYIHDKLIEKAKEKLSTTNLSVREIAYELRFEHPQSFSKLFKSKASFRHWSSGSRLIDRQNLMKYRLSSIYVARCSKQKCL